jgi:hypothetical protein
MTSRDDFRRANQRAKDLEARFPPAVSAHYGRKTGRIVVHLSSKVIVRFSPADAEGLERAQPSQLKRNPDHAIRFWSPRSALDVDLYVPGLFEGFLGSKAWMVSRLGQMGDQSRSKGKQAASRLNGKLGGRPRKTVER